jgi:hypothetical protein
MSEEKAEYWTQEELDAAEVRVPELLALLEPEVCEWSYDYGLDWWGWKASRKPDHEYWIDPNENEYKFCPYCGKPIKVRK